MKSQFGTIKKYFSISNENKCSQNMSFSSGEAFCDRLRPYKLAF